MFDGHGERGDMVSKIVRNQLPSLLLGQMNNRSVTRDSKTICEAAFLTMDKRILKLKNIHDCSSSGSAAVVAVKHVSLYRFILCDVLLLNAIYIYNSVFRS